MGAQAGKFALQRAQPLERIEPGHGPRCLGLGQGSIGVESACFRVTSESSPTSPSLSFHLAVKGAETPTS